MGGFEVLDAMERIPTYKAKEAGGRADAPKQPIKITNVIIYTNPFLEPFTPVDELTREKAEAPVAEDPNDYVTGAWFSNPTPVHQPKPVSEGIGKYISAPISANAQPAGKKRSAAASIPAALALPPPFTSASLLPPAIAAAVNGIAVPDPDPTKKRKVEATGAKPTASFGNFSNW